MQLRENHGMRKVMGQMHSGICVAQRGNLTKSNHTVAHNLTFRCARSDWIIQNRYEECETGIVSLIHLVDDELVRQQLNSIEKHVKQPSTASLRDCGAPS